MGSDRKSFQRLEPAIERVWTMGTMELEPCLYCGNQVAVEYRCGLAFFSRWAVSEPCWVFVCPEHKVLMIKVIYQHTLAAKTRAKKALVKNWNQEAKDYRAGRDLTRTPAKGGMLPRGLLR